MVYMLWPESNEAYFCLMMKFIVFINQYYQLQSSFLGQLHSDGSAGISLSWDFLKKFLLTVCSGSTNCLSLIFCLLKNKTSINLIFNLLILTFFG